MLNKVCLVTLGCAKNQVDSEMVLGMLNSSDFEITNDPEKADLIVINTCGFIEASKKESINTILEYISCGKKLVVIGCLVERYYDDLVKEIPEVDLFVRIKDYYKINDLLKTLLNKDVVQISPFNRVLSTPKFTAYLRISEGCNNCCTYCAIPLIRGSYRSRPLKDLVKEAKDLKDRGIKELVVISQDVTRYGSDFKDRTTLVTLLKELDKIGFYSIRLLYLYPDEITDELIDYIFASKSVANYFDIPIQHASSKVLKDMNRRGDKEHLLELFSKIKSHKNDEYILRTTLIVGFPGENDDDFKELTDFIKNVEFDHLGCFTYSREEGTKSFDFDNQIDESIKQERYEEIMDLQQGISYKNNKKHLGEIMEGIVTNFDKKNNQYYLRSYYNAPDDIDGNIIFTSKNDLEIGDIVKVRINSVFVYDLMGEKIDN